MQRKRHSSGGICRARRAHGEGAECRDEEDAGKGEESEVQRLQFLIDTRGRGAKRAQRR